MILKEKMLDTLNLTFTFRMEAFMVPCRNAEMNFLDESTVENDQQRL